MAALVLFAFAIAPAVGGRGGGTAARAARGPARAVTALAFGRHLHGITAGEALGAPRAARAASAHRGRGGGIAGDDALGAPPAARAAFAFGRRACVVGAGAALGALGALRAPAFAGTAVAPTAQSADRLAKAALAAAEGRLDEAARLTAQVIELQPRYAGGFSARASLAVQRGDYAGALADYDAALELGAVEGEEGVIRLNRGVVLIAVGRPADALVDLDRSLALDRGNRLAALNRALALLDLDREDDAFAALRPLVATAGPTAVEPFWLIYALLLAERAPVSEATGVLRRLEAKFRSADDVHAALALTLAQEGRDAAAREQWRLVRDPAPFRSAERLARKPKRWPRAAARALQERLAQLEP
ncbi:hypothetical protein KFE25_003627 [Diacronema lutheri]|uniref:Tetratricopeptide repeat protein n=2 Tax=Diacronema lutheri TaxID=2081491 RepID=A0A8J5X7F8_DIALT|nr:hypothetical protein KFE25_003627 [Diacronema lutheri]